jgi:thiamine biosynthesis lipoprotein
MRMSMGTWVAIEATAESETVAAKALEAAFAAFAAIEQRMHPTRAGSDVARINAAALGARTPIHASTARVLSLALTLNRLTDGVFDPCLPTERGRVTDLELGDSSDGAPWVIAHAPLALDLGGIAKGYAVDCAVEALREAGCVAGGVNAGGDLRLFGTRPETVLVRRADRSLWPLVLENAALAVSDLDEPRRPPEHRGFYVRSGAPIPRDADAAVERHAAVLAADAMSADALTKCVLLCRKETARRALAALGGRSLGRAGPDR